MKKLLLSIIAVVVTVAALGTSTFAWFTLSNKAEIGQFNAEVTAGDGIELSLDGDNWYSVLTSDLINGWLEVEYGATPVLTDLTSSNGVTFSKMVLTDDTTEDSGNEYGTVTYVPETEGFIEFQVFFRAQAATDIYWTDAQLGGEENEWISDAEFTYHSAVVATNSVTVSAANAARISVAEASAATAFVYELAGSGTNFHLGSGTGVTVPAAGAVSYFNAKNEYNQIPAATTINLPVNVFNEFTENGIVGTTEVPDGQRVLTLIGSEVVNGITYKTGSVDVRVWIEGWDADAFNAILSLPLFASLKFEGVTIA
ncbi:MAG: hypothetical protein RBQ95_04635 [Paracholeplasma sp.]|nr:hypothetical protein [Paracholeplasma sp.]MDY3196126.1 hypothetical protein [Paracholeplasma sp.]